MAAPRPRCVVDPLSSSSVLSCCRCKIHVVVRRVAHGVHTRSFRNSFGIWCATHGQQMGPDTKEVEVHRGLNPGIGKANAE